ncbi:MAG TPA: hypothetical protein VN493_09535 [Thermoanaerobaculia bacterium]|nr:hypothetical protein [Thermoanaerobaculia bacterium]
MFRKVQLGPDEEPLRRMIALANPGEPWEYGCALNQLQDIDDFKRVVMFPGEMKLEGHKGFHFMAWGYHWRFVVSSHASSLPYDELFLTPEGKLPIRVSSIKASDLVQGMLRGERVVEKPAANPGMQGTATAAPDAQARSASVTSRIGGVIADATAGQR